VNESLVGRGEGWADLRVWLRGCLPFYDFDFLDMIRTGEEKSENWKLLYGTEACEGIEGLE